MTIRFTEDEYYTAMSEMCEYSTFRELHVVWYKCFSYILRSRKVGYTERLIRDLFYEYELNGIIPVDASECREKFDDNCKYISDRASYDRLFYTHYLFIHAYRDEFMNVRFGEI